jgi:cellulose 1,4-beta-cellobiosidase
MKGLYTAVAASAISGVFAAPSPVEKGPTPRAAAAACSTAVTLSGNPFTNRQLFANPYYAAEVQAAVTAISDSTLAASAAKVAAVGSFQWM